MNKILLIVLLCLVIIILLKYNTCEPFENVCKELQVNVKAQILKYNEGIISAGNFQKTIDIIIDPFVNLKKIEPEITIEEYLVEKKIPVGDIDKAVFLIKSIVNNNCLMSALSEYDVLRKTLLRDVVQTFLLDSLKNSLICLIPDKKVIELIVQQLGFLIIKPHVEICSTEKFKQYCEANYTQIQQEISDNVDLKIISVNVNQETKSETKNEKTNKKKMCKVANKKQIEKFASELGKTAEEIKSGTMKILDIESKMLPLVSNSPKFMGTESIEKVIKSFNASSLGEDVQTYMKELMDEYRKKYNKDLNISIKDDFGNFVLVLIDNFNLLIEELRGDNLCEGEEDDGDEIDNLVNKFNGYKKIYYMLKHYYKIVSVYELINDKVKESDEKLQAMLCCSRQGENTCHNFSKDVKNPSAIIYGFNDYGYVNNIKCIKGTPEALANEEEQKKSLDEILSSKYEIWKNISRENKAIIYVSVINIFKIYGAQLSSIEGKLGDVRKNLRNISNKISISDFTKIVKVRESNIINKLNITSPDYLNAIDLINKAENMETLSKILANYGFTKEQVVFNANVLLNVAKEIAKVAVFSKFIFSNFYFSNSSQVIVKIMGIMKTKQSFNEIFAETNIVPRYFSLIQQAIMTGITNGKFAVISKHDMNSIPNNVINYIQSKPIDQSLTLCNVYGLALDKFRKDRVISVNDYINMDDKMNIYCNPNKIKLDKLNSTNIPVSESKGLNVLERAHPDYPTFVIEHDRVVKKNMKSEIVSDNILYNFIKNTYN
jgi:hypothetical protein